MFIPKSFYSSVDVEYDIENILLTPTDNLTTALDKSSETLSLTTKFYDFTLYSDEIFHTYV
jgi:hypothetical protein